MECLRPRCIPGVGAVVDVKKVENRPMSRQACSRARISELLVLMTDGGA